MRAEVEHLYHEDFGVSDLNYVSEAGLRFSRNSLEPTDGYQWPRVARAWKVCDSVQGGGPRPEGACRSPRALFGRQGLALQHAQLPGRHPATGALRTRWRFSQTRPGCMCGVWVALEDMDMDNGPLVYYPGSHKLPWPTWDEIDELTGRGSIRRADFETLRRTS